MLSSPATLRPPGASGGEVTGAVVRLEVNRTPGAVHKDAGSQAEVFRGGNQRHVVRLVRVDGAWSVGDFTAVRPTRRSRTADTGAGNVVPAMMTGSSNWEGALMGKVRTAVVVIGAGAKVAAKYGPQAKIAWDKGGKQAAESAARRARTMTARRKALAHAATIIDGSILKVAPEGITAYVVFSGELPVAAYPPQERRLDVLIAHTDLGRRERPHRPEPKGAKVAGVRDRLPRALKKRD
ncbi:MAG: hypothetical protein L0H93_18645 [Nocardioides sp.]|nr:hypothetical protein [Nocardioides sp.]